MSVGYIPIILMLVAFFAAGSTAAAGEREAIIHAMQQWESAVERGDYEALANYYTEDAIYYPNQSAPLRGSEAILERNRARGSDARVRITQEVDDIVINGSWAVYSCLAEIEVQSGTGSRPAPVKRVRVMLVMQKGDDGRWRIHRDIDNIPPSDTR